MELNERQNHQLAFAFFVIAATLGLLMRAAQQFDFGFTYKFVKHGHSHIALMGWVYNCLITLLGYQFLPNNKLRKFQQIFWATQITIFGMLFTFPFQGYALFSIIFSTLFLIASYWFTAFFIKNTTVEYNNSLAKPFIKSGLAFLVICSLGPWLLGYVMRTQGPTSTLYQLCIYFYLHFLYNGFMVFALLGLFVFNAENHQLITDRKQVKEAYQLILAGTILTFFLSTLFFTNAIPLFVIGGLGAVLQLLGFIQIYKLGLKQLGQQLKAKPLFQCIVGLFIIKLVLQLLSALPYFVDLLENRVEFVIGYLHLVFLGCISLSLLYLLIQKELTFSKTTLYLYIVGFLGTEILLFYKGVELWQQWPFFKDYYVALTIASCILLAGIFGLFLNILRSKKNKKIER